MYVETFKMLIGLLNNNSNLTVIRTYQSLSVTFILSTSHIVLHVMYVTHSQLGNQKAFERNYKFYWGAIMLLTLRITIFKS